MNGLTLESAELRRCVIRFFDSTWWKRSWTVQEYVLAQNLVFQCGQSSVTREMVNTAIENYIFHGDNCCVRAEFSQKIEKVDPTLKKSLTMAYAVSDKPDTFRRLSGSDFSLLLAISTFWNRGVNDPREKIYCMLSLGRGMYANLVFPDYSITSDYLCVATAMTCLGRTRKFEFLSHVVPHQNPDLPSFIPDWTGKFEWNYSYDNRLSNLEMF